MDSAIKERRIQSNIKALGLDEVRKSVWDELEEQKRLKEEK